MNILDIVGPVMVGPSSSHTAGAVRIGQTVGKLLGERVVNAKIGLHGSFLATGRGHGTDRAIVAGVCGGTVGAGSGRPTDSGKLRRSKKGRAFVFL